VAGRHPTGVGGRRVGLRAITPAGQKPARGEATS
jgi:hypothetical protein